MSEENLPEEKSELAPAKRPAKPTPAPPNDNFVLPSMNLIWPIIMQTFEQVRTAAQGALSKSSPQVQGDWALGTAVLTICNVYTTTQLTTDIGYQATILSNFTVNNVKNIGQLNPAPPSPSGDDAALKQWIMEQIPDESETDLFPVGKNGTADYLLWGMACREMLTANGWDVSGLTFSTVMPEKSTLYVSGRFLYDRHGNQVVLRGVDYPLLDDPNFPTSDYLNEIVQTGANAIRIQWYINYGARDKPYTTADLGNFIDRCVAADIIPIVMLADETCQSDPTLVNSQLVPWWTAPAQVSILKPREGCLILNLANELGYYRWADDSATALPAYISAYKTAIASMRAAGYNLPLMIDAPDCGSTLDAFITSGAELVSADPLGNILLSAHAYWAGYDGRPYVPTAAANNLPIVFGEIANKQDEVIDGKTVYGYYDLDGTKQDHPASTGYTYQSFLSTLVMDQIGWLSWCWTNDYCSARQMSSNGSFNALTTYGKDLVNNATYGLKATAVRIKP